MAYTIYLSSTLKDLAAERQAAKEALQGHAVKESYGASENSLIATCLDDVNSCDLYVLIIGLRYGYRPDALIANPHGLSITELEYQRAVDKNIPRLVFVKEEGVIVATNTDSHTGEADPALIHGFRERVSDGSNETPARFSQPVDLKFEVVRAFSAFKARRESKTALLGLGTDARHPAELRVDLSVICAAGTDSAAQAAINARADTRFRADEISPDDPRFLQSLDAIVRTARAAGLLITPASLPRFARKGLVEAALGAMAQRCGRAFLLLDRVAVADLPPEWLAAVGGSAFAVAASGIGTPVNTAAPGAAADALARTHQVVREHAPSIANDRRIGVPCMVIALNESNVADFTAPAGSVFQGFGVTQRATRRSQFTKLTAAIRRSHPGWPHQFYGPRGEDWRPYGPGGPTSGDLLGNAFERINADRRAGSRERRLLRDFRLQPQPYAFEDYCNDRWGSRAMVEDARDRGCLVLLDEMSLLHSGLRPHIDSFLIGQRVAVVSINPCDPCHLSTRDLLDEFSHLRVGTLFARFRDQEDPRCELSLNSPARLQRWLRLVLPELVTTLSQEESQVELVARTTDLLKPTSP